MEENVIQIIGGIMIKVDMNVKNVTYVKKTIFGVVLCQKYLANIMDDLVIMCEEVIEPYHKKIKNYPQQTLIKRKRSIKLKISTFCLRF